MIRKVEKEDLNAIAAIHKENFNDHFLGKFSETLLSEFYGCFIGGESFIADFTEQGECRGFILGGWLPWIKECKTNFICNYRRRYIKEIIMRPKTWIDTLRRVYDLITEKFQMSFCPARQMKRNNDSGFCLLSIAVAKKQQQSGVASRLVKYYEEKCPSDSYRLSVHTNNMKAICFYKKMNMIEIKRENGCIEFEKFI